MNINALYSTKNNTWTPASNLKPDDYDPLNATWSKKPSVEGFCCGANRFPVGSANEQFANPLFSSEKNTWTSESDLHRLNVNPMKNSWLDSQVTKEGFCCGGKNKYVNGSNIWTPAGNISPQNTPPYNTLWSFKEPYATPNFVGYSSLKNTWSLQNPYSLS